MADAKKSSIKNSSSCHLLNIKDPKRVKQRLKLSFQRVKAKVAILKSGNLVDASLALIDISESGAGFFSDRILPKGAMVELMLTDPRMLKAKGVVVWSVPVDSGMDTRGFPFRNGVQFVYENELQRTAVIEFCNKVLMAQEDLLNLRPKETLNADTPAVPAAPAATAPETASTPPAGDAGATVSASEVDSLLNQTAGAAPQASEAPAAAPSAEAPAAAAAPATEAAPAAAEQAGEEKKAA